MVHYPPFPVRLAGPVVLLLVLLSGCSRPQAAAQIVASNAISHLDQNTRAGGPTLLVDLETDRALQDNPEATVKIPTGLVGVGGYKDEELNLSFIDTSVKPEFRRSNGDQDGYELRWGDSSGPKEVVWTEPTQEREWPILSQSRIATDQRFSSGGPAINLNPSKPRTDIQGTYTIHTNFAGDAKIQAGSLFKYLPELKVVSPAPDSRVSKGQPLKVEWKPVSGAEAYYVVAYSGDEDQKMIKWSNSEHSERWWEKGFSESVQTGAFLPQDTTSVSIPTIPFSGEVDIEVVALGYPQIGTGDFPITAWSESRCRFSVLVK